MNTRTMCMVFALVLTLGCLSAQGQSLVVRADVPFGFVAGETSLPAGTYEISALQPKVVFMRTTDRSKSAMLLTNSVVSADRNGKPRLAFNKYGDAYFLSEVWIDTAIGNAVWKGRKEKDVALYAAHGPSRVTLVATSKK